MAEIRRLFRNHGVDALTVLVLMFAGYLASAPLRERWARSRAERASIASVAREWRDLRSEVSPLSGDAAAIEVVEISDYECPFCRGAAASVDTAVASGLRVGYLNYPLAIHRHAEGAAIASLCAESAGKFREMHARLMGTTNWLNDSNWVSEAKAAGVADLRSFEQCIHGDAVRVRLARERALADSLGIHATPTFVSREVFHRGTATASELLGFDRKK